MQRRGGAAWVFHNPATGRYWQATPRLYRLAALLDGRTTIEAALRALPPPRPDDDTEGALLRGVAGMISAGLLAVPGAVRPPAVAPGGALGIIRRIAFSRLRLGDLGRILPVAGPLLGWLFTAFGALALLVLLLAAGWSWSDQGAALAAQWARLADPTFGNAVLAYLLFIAAKLLHEIGHAVAVRRMAAAEGHAIRVVPWGVTFMFLLPAPYVDASASWFLQSRWRRATVGLAGIATDLLVAALAALLWSAVGPGALKDRLFELVLICSVSSLVFNLNPLIKLDGYYVLSDLLGIENMLARAQQALGRVMLGQGGAGDGLAGFYALIAWVWRLTIYGGIFWLASGVHWLLAAAVAGIATVLLIAVPLVTLLTRHGATLRAARGRVAVVAASGLALIGAAALVPVPAHVVAEGVVVDNGLSHVFAGADAQLLMVAEPGATGTVLRLDNPETTRRLAQLAAEAAALEIEMRRARSGPIAALDAHAARQAAVAVQIAALDAERAAYLVVAPSDAHWEPLDAARLTGAWVRRDDPRPLGAVLRPAAPEIRLVLDQWDGPVVLAALAREPAASVPLRLRGETAASFRAQPLGPGEEARDTLPSPALAHFAGGRIPARPDARGEARPIERVFELRLAPEAPAPLLRHGARVEARIALRPAPLAEQAWRRLRQLLQPRFAV